MRDADEGGGVLLGDSHEALAPGLGISLQAEGDREVSEGRSEATHLQISSHSTSANHASRLPSHP